MKQLSELIKQTDERVASLDATRGELLLDDSESSAFFVPVGSQRADNVEVRRWGTPPKFDFTPKPHWEVGERAGILDLPAATKITGARFAVYKNWVRASNGALANFFWCAHAGTGYTEILPPFWSAPLRCSRGAASRKFGGRFIR